MEYMILHRDNSADLAEEVNRAISNGWKPLGGVSVAMAPLSEADTYHLVYVQAMIREDY